MAVEIVVEIDTTTGEMKTEINGIQGPACDQIADKIKELAGQPTNETKKPEYHVRPQVRQKTSR